MTTKPTAKNVQGVVASHMDGLFLSGAFDVIRKLIDRGIPTRSITRDRGQTDRSEIARSSWRKVGWRTRGRTADSARHIERGHLIQLPGARIGKKLIQHEPERMYAAHDIQCGRGGCCETFRRDVRQGNHKSIGLGQHRVRSTIIVGMRGCSARVDHAHPTVRFDDQVRRLDVSVHHASAVAFCDTTTRPQDDVEPIIEVNIAASALTRDVLGALHEFHGKPRPLAESIVDDASVNDACDAITVKRREHLDLEFEPPNGLF